MKIDGMDDIQKCVMYDKKKKSCTGLNRMYCLLDGKCGFYKTKEMVAAEQRKIEKRREERGL